MNSDLSFEDRSQRIFVTNERESEKLSRYIELVSYGKSYMGTVYRGEMMNDEKLILHLISDIHTEWYSSIYLSTSKSRQVTEKYGSNVLIIINIQKSDNRTEQAIDISALSAVPDDEEVLLTPGYRLSKKKYSEFDPILKNHLIYLTSTHSSVPPIIQNNRYEHRKIKQKVDCSLFSSTSKRYCKENQ